MTKEYTGVFGRRWLTVVINDVLNIAHDLGIAPLRLRCHVVYGLAAGLENGCRLRVQHEGHCKQPLESIECSRFAGATCSVP
jgi:hypothetical protein